jgi:predicted DNA-binding transcriptional regulator AlpA
METIDTLLRRLVREEVAAALADLRAAPKPPQTATQAPVNASVEGRWLTEQQVADRIGFVVSTLQSWRSEETGPPYVKVGRMIRYDEDALGAWQRAQPAIGGDI